MLLEIPYRLMIKMRKHGAILLHARCRLKNPKKPWCAWNRLLSKNAKVGRFGKTTY
jgi:hypothetical protein